MKDILSDIINKLRDGIYKNEEHIRLSLVARLIQALDWNIWDSREVYTEYSPFPEEDQTKVDMALFLPPSYDIPSVFVEIKSVGKLDGDISKIEKQLRDYNRNNTALFSIVTDGRKWRFYYSQTGGGFSQKCFKIMDLLQDKVEDLELYFDAFLSKSEIKNGVAKREAEKYLESNKKKRAMKDVFPEASRLTSKPPFPSLPEAIVKLCKNADISVSLEEAKHFLKDIIKEPIPPEISEDCEIISGEDAHISRNVSGSRIEIVLENASAKKKYALIPLKNNRSYFPGYKESFFMQTDIGKIKTKVTSAPLGTKIGDPEAGGYIQGGLKAWFVRHNNLKDGDVLLIEKIEDMKLYRLSIKSRSR